MPPVYRRLTMKKPLIIVGVLMLTVAPVVAQLGATTR